MKQFLSCIILVSVFAGCRAQPKPAPLAVSETENTLLWRVSGNHLKKPSYLFGTFHLLCKSDIHFSDQLKKAIDRSDTVYMEMDMDDPSTMLSGMLYMNMKDGKKIKDLLTPAEFERLSVYFNDTLKMPFNLFQSAKPYFLVALFYPRLMQCENASGVEQELLTIIKESGKEVKGLETMQYQASVFDRIPYEWQAKELMKNVDSFQVTKDEFERMVQVYKDQRLDSMQAMFNEGEFSSNEYGKYLLDERNENWVSQLKKIMQDQSVFVAVGAGHLPGDMGLISLLRKAGYKVEPLNNN